MKLADVTLRWKNPPGIVKTQLFIINNGVTTEREYDPSVLETQITMQASTSCQYRVVTFNVNGDFEQGGVYSFTLNDLVKPQPATCLSHEVGNIRDE